MPDLFDASAEDRARLAAAGWVPIDYFGQRCWRDARGRLLTERLAVEALERDGRQDGN